jgi:predicted short-subunit dehydrogenase-like oxidoreductase (DUF2520 family)
MHPTSNSLTPAPQGELADLRVGIVGAGRLGTALAAALRDAGVRVEGPAGRGEVPERCDAIVLCVPDAEIAAAAASVAGAAPLMGHTSGATPLTALEPAGGAAFAMHPLQTFPERAAVRERAPGERPFAGRASGVRPFAERAASGRPFAERDSAPALAAFAGAGCAVAGTTPEARAFAGRLARLLGMTPFEIDDEGRAAYHAAASVASNFTVTLLAAAERIADGAGLAPHEARALLAPLVRRTVESVAELDPASALTGPVARGDQGTVEAQRRAIEDAAPELLDLFDELVRHTRALAGHEVTA